MRELTKNEQKLVTVIVNECSPRSVNTLGEIFMSIYEISFMQKYIPDESEEGILQESDYSSVLFQFKINKERNFVSEIYEAILLLLLLEKEGYIFLNLFSLLYEKDTIGKKVEITTNIEGDLYDNKRIHDDFSGNRLWGILNSNCIVTNSLRDYAKDFKTEEQRRFRKSIILTWIAITISFISCILSFLHGFIIK